MTVFFWWTMHFLLARRVRWRDLARPALTSGIAWAFFALFSSLYFSSSLVEDDHPYGEIGVVFTLLTWFIVIGGVIMLGATVGAVWQQRAVRRADAAAVAPPPDLSG